jgi:hypothetical protein
MNNDLDLIFDEQDYKNEEVKNTLRTMLGNACKTLAEIGRDYDELNE